MGGINSLVVNPYYPASQGPGPDNAVVLTADGLMINGQLIKDALGLRLYDTFRVKAGVPVTETPWQFFSIPQGQQQAGLNFGTQYEKTVIDTNLQQAKQIPRGAFFLVASVQIRILMPGALDTSYGTSGPSTEMPTDAAPVGQTSAANELKEILEAGYMRFHVGDKDYEEGKFIHFPSPYGITGFAGFGIAPGEGAGDALAIANNGFGRPYRLAEPRHIEGQRLFYVGAQWGYSFTPRHNFNVECVLEGKYWRSVA